MYKKGKTDPKGTSIEERPFKPEDRSEFGHWRLTPLLEEETLKILVLYSL